jgi:hypothetical protein
MLPDAHRQSSNSCRVLCTGQRLEFHSGEGGLIDVVAWNVPARRETGLVEYQRPLAVGDDPVAMMDHEIAGGWRTSMRW